MFEVNGFIVFRPVYLAIGPVMKPSHGQMVYSFRSSVLGEVCLWLPSPEIKPYCNKSGQNSIYMLYIRVYIQVSSYIQGLGG